MKTCIKCDKPKCIDDFARKRRGKIVFENICIDCRRTHRREYNQKTIDRRRYIQQEYMKQTSVKISHRVRTRIAHAFTKSGIQESASFNYVGCSKEEYVDYLLESAPKDFTWNNYGKYSFNIDHIIPVCMYDLHVEQNRYRCFNYRNTRIVSYDKNCSKAGILNMELVKTYNIFDLLPFGFIEAIDDRPR